MAAVDLRQPWAADALQLLLRVDERTVLQLCIQLPPLMIWVCMLLNSTRTLVEAPRQNSSERVKNAQRRPPVQGGKHKQ